MKEIMVLGTFHMESDADVVNVQNKEMLEEMDSEFEKLNGNLAKFKPNKFFVELERDYQADLEKAFEKYKSNGKTAQNEIFKIAFPVAKACDAKVIAVDWMEQGAAVRSCGDVMDALWTEPDLKALVDSFEAANIDLNKGLIENLRLVNSEEETSKSKAFYVNLARLGVKDYFGMGWLIWWYQRNLNIFANIAANMEENDRGIVLIGAAHKGLLEEMFNDSRDFTLEDTAKYL
ncbi:MAG: hypothetical protein K6F63_08285 [Lachnospiraceae bacterium]|nr:hypothetical protein [Lachnospiraceae bacterium]